MKAIAFSRHLPISDPASLEDITLPAPVATGRDLVVRIQAVCGAWSRLAVAIMNMHMQLPGPRGKHPLQ